MRRIWSGARTHLRNGKPISIEGRRRKRRRDSGTPWCSLCAGAGRGDPGPAFGRPCPPEFVERIRAMRCLNERVGRAPWKRVERSSSVRFRGTPSSSPASFSHAAGAAAAPGSAPLHCDYSLTQHAECSTRSPAKRPTLSSRLLRMLSLPMGKINLRERSDKENNTMACICRN